MTSDEKKFDKLHKKWMQARTARNKASKNHQDAFAAYHWTVADDGAKWKRALSLRDRETVAFEKEEAAFKALEDFMRARAKELT